jgi:EmrB/QacA subfamily drug resistance transporter
MVRILVLLEALMPAAPATNHKWLVLILALLSQFMLVLDVSVVNIALPDIRSGLGFSESNLGWVINAYTLAFGGFLMLGGRAADLFGHKRVFLIGLSFFTAASLLNALATSPEILIAGRALQGLGAAFASPAALAVVTTAFPQATERARALAAWAAVSAGGGAFGLILGGVLVQALSWEWIFLVNVPIGVAVAVVGSRVIPAGIRSSGAFDLAGATTITGGLVAVVYAIVSAGDHGWGSTGTIVFGAAGLALLTAFVLIERRSADPLVRLSIFRERALAVGDLTILLLTASMISFFFFASLYLQDTLGYGPLKTGLAFLPITLLIIVVAGAAQNVVGRIGVRAMGVMGMTLAAIGMALLVSVPEDGSYVTHLLLPFIPFAVGAGFAFVALTMLGTAGVGPEDAGLASGLYNTAQQVGGALGLAVLSSIAVGASTTMGVYHIAFAGGAIMLAAGAVLLLVTLRPSHVAHVTEAAPEGVMI